MMDYKTSAAFLYDGGWRSEDKEQLKTEYELTDMEAEEICKRLSDLERK